MSGDGGEPEWLSGFDVENAGQPLKASSRIGNGSSSITKPTNSLMKFPIAALLYCSLLASLHGDDRLAGAREFLDAHRVYTQEIVPPANYDELQAKITAMRDPETKFGPYIFGLANPKSEVLSAEQRNKLKALIEARRTNPVNWHDVRNIVRVQSLLTLWEYAGATDDVRVAELDLEWRAWNELRLAYMFEEFVMQDRFQRAARDVFTPAQRKKIAAGDYDKDARMNTGHSRAFFADRHVLKALGKPENQAAFDQVQSEWEKKWKAVSEKIKAAAKFDRKREMAMDLVDESFAVASAMEAQKAFSAFTTAERDAIRALVQAGYAGDPDLQEKVGKARGKLKEKMKTDYREHGADLLRAMGEIVD